MGCLPPDLFVCMQGVLVGEGEGETATSYGLYTAENPTAL